MKAFRDTPSSRLQRCAKRLLTQPVRMFLLRVPFLPQSAARALDDIRFVEPDVLRFVSNTIRRGWCCVDVGAHCGTVSVRLAKLVSPNGRVVAVEPISANVDLLVKNLRHKGLSDRCAVLVAAVGAGQGEMKMVRGDHSTTWHAAAPGESPADFETVSLRRLDDILANYPPPDFVKVDIEGAENELVEGAQETISKARPLWLFEMHGPAAWSLASIFFRSGYRAFDLKGEELGDPLPASLGYGHVIFCPQEKIPLLAAGR